MNFPEIHSKTSFPFRPSSSKMSANISDVFSQKEAEERQGRPAAYVPPPRPTHRHRKSYTLIDVITVNMLALFHKRRKNDCEIVNESVFTPVLSAAASPTSSNAEHVLLLLGGPHFSRSKCCTNTDAFPSRWLTSSRSGPGLIFVNKP